MEQTALRQLLTALIATWENEVVEFKQAGHDYNTDAIGEYFSAPSNAPICSANSGVAGRLKTSARTRRPAGGWPREIRGWCGKLEFVERSAQTHPNNQSLTSICGLILPRGCREKGLTT